VCMCACACVCMYVCVCVCVCVCACMRVPELRRPGLAEPRTDTVVRRWLQYTRAYNLLAECGSPRSDCVRVE
jgi:hypothetical protein